MSDAEIVPVGPGPEEDEQVAKLDVEVTPEPQSAWRSSSSALRVIGKPASASQLVTAEQSTPPSSSP